MKITIITTSFNSAQTIESTLKSVLQQSYTDFEYLLIDGCSTDGTLDIIRCYEPLFDGRLKVFSEPDDGIYDAMNKGIAKASGEIVGFLNSDDFFTSDDVLSTLAKTFDVSGDIDAVYGDVHYVDETDLTKTVRYYSSHQFYREKMRRGYMPAHPSFYCKKTCFEKFGNYDCTFKIAADFEWLLRVIYNGKIRMSYIPKDFVTMRTGGASSSGLKSHLQIFKDHWRAFRKNGVKTNYLLYCTRYLQKLTEFHS